MRLTPIILSVALVLMLAMPMLPSIRATPADEVVRTFAPTAIDFYSMGAYNPEYAKKLDGGSGAIAADYGSITTENHFDPDYASYWSPWENRSNFPPAPATILSVSVISVVHCQIARTYAIRLSINLPGEASHTFYSPSYSASWADTLQSYNVTADLAAIGMLVPANWSAATVSTYLITDLSYGKALYVDYIGLDYSWTNGTGWGGGGAETELNVGGIDVPGIMGIFGFVGMIAVPAVSIWFYQRDGGSKIATAIIALVGFLVCFGMFFGVINGG